MEAEEWKRVSDCHWDVMSCWLGCNVAVPGRNYVSGAHLELYMANAPQQPVGASMANKQPWLFSLPAVYLITPMSNLALFVGYVFATISSCNGCLRYPDNM